MPPGVGVRAHEAVELDAIASQQLLHERGLRRCHQHHHIERSVAHSFHRRLAIEIRDIQIALAEPRVLE